MKEFLIVGVDVSKSTLDIYFKPAGSALRIDNNLHGFKLWHKEFKRLWDGASKALVVMEHTGQYSYRFETFLRSRFIDYCKLPALQIKRSLGMIRGKNDKVDAVRIAGYGWLRRDILMADQYPGQEIRALRALLSLRHKLVRDISGYKSRFREMIATGTCVKSDWQGNMHQQIIDFMESKKAMVEARINTLITAHPNLQKTSQLLRSIKGVGLIISSYMIGCTENFKRFSNARKFNCYAGLAPFTHQSGSSIKGKARVSHMANKAVKTLLNMGASSAIQHNKELKEYYQRRIEKGMGRMSCLNIIRSKLISRMFAVIKRQTPYQEVAPAA